MNYFKKIALTNQLKKELATNYENYVDCFFKARTLTHKLYLAIQERQNKYAQDLKNAKNILMAKQLIPALKKNIDEQKKLIESLLADEFYPQYLADKEFIAKLKRQEQYINDQREVIINNPTDKKLHRKLGLLPTIEEIQILNEALKEEQKFLNNPNYAKFTTMSRINADISNNQTVLNELFEASNSGNMAKELEILKEHFSSYYRDDMHIQNRINDLRDAKEKTEKWEKAFIDVKNRLESLGKQNVVQKFEEKNFKIDARINEIANIYQIPAGTDKLPSNGENLLRDVYNQRYVLTPLDRKQLEQNIKDVEKMVATLPKEKASKPLFSEKEFTL